MDYVEFTIKVNSKWQEQVIADLSPLGFSGFQQFDDSVTGYITGEQYSDQLLEKVEQILDQYDFNADIQSQKEIEDQNWNDEWEQTLAPQFVGKFFIKPSWSEISPPSDTTLLQIDPKMSFGTGYHETTRLILRKIPEIVNQGDHVLDAGTGTGILAIAAVKMGAEWVFGFDVDEWSYRNATENAELNEVAEKISLAHGDQSVIPTDRTFDLIIANINQSVIVPMLPTMVEMLKVDGALLLSGLTDKDQQIVEDTSILKSAASLVEVTHDNEWICMQYKKTSQQIASTQ